MSCNNPCSEIENRWRGNGTQTEFKFTFTYEEQSDVYVSRWDEDEDDWVAVPNTEWVFKNATTIEFNTAPPANPVSPEDVNVRIFRCTDIDPLKAKFYPGSAIRAKDLNDNFEQLQFAIEEGRCTDDYLDRNKWDKNKNETIDSTEEFECVDDKVATAGAICKKIDDEFTERTITEAQQRAGLWVDGNLNTDEKIASAAAISERHDPFFQDARPQDRVYSIPAREWWDSDDQVYRVWDQQNATWLAVTGTGPAGPEGPEGTYATIVSETAPTQRLSGQPIRNGDVWFNSTIGEAFIWYEDPNTNQWVSISVTGPPGADGPPGPEGQYTFEPPLELDNGTVSINLQILNGTP